MPTFIAMKDLGGYLEPKQIKRILASALNERDHMLILMCWRTGRRISEVLQVKIKDIDYDKGLILFNILKKRNKEYKKWKPIDERLLISLRKYTANKNPQRYLFPSPYKPEEHLSRQQAHNIFRKAAERAGIYQVGEKHPHCHHLRHSFSVNFVKRAKNKGTAIKTLQSILEHRTVEMTSTYLQFSQEDTRAELEHVFKEEEEE